MDIKVGEPSISRPVSFRDLRPGPEQPVKKTEGSQSDKESREGQDEAMDPEELRKAVSGAEAYAQSIRRDLKFSLDDRSGEVVVKVTDSTTGEVIRQMPSEEALKLAQRLEEARSLLFKTKA